jgi:ketosteroid isomerase-like protein
MLVAGILLLGLTVFSKPMVAQNFRQEINHQVWKPFISTYSSFDADGFLSLHSKDLIRSARESNKILTWEEYRDQQLASMKTLAESGIKRTIDLRFTERIANAEKAIDVGIYKTTRTTPDGKSQSFYGRFFVILQNENGTWKILVDTDSSEGGTVDEADFQSAVALE